MKIALGLVLLLALFLAAAIWQDRLTDDLRLEREAAARELDEGRVGRELPPGWIEVVIGAPSGAPPVEAPRQPFPQAAQGTPAGLAGDAPVHEAAGTELVEGEPDGSLPDFELEVAPGQSLGTIAHAHYGTAPVRLVEALAAYNGLADADRLTVGQVLYLPPYEVLVPPAQE